MRVHALVALCIASIPIEPSGAQDQTWSLDISGELRERFESANHPAFGVSTPAHNHYLLHRAILTGEIRHRGAPYAVVEVVSGLTSDWTRPPPTQEDPFDLLQAYLERSLSVSRGQLTLRVGRQELKLGASRLVSVRESPNIRRAFDGVRASWTTSANLSATAFFVRPVFPADGVLDDRSSSEQHLWGVYGTWPVRSIEGLGVDAYYLGLDRHGAVFAQGQARERRNTVGARAFGERTGWDWNIEAAWQWGSFGDSSIRAWTISLDAGFEFSTVPLAPRVGIKADAISGDRSLNDRQLGTFNPLFPRLPYFSEANLATPANLLDVQPHVRLSLTKRLRATIGWNGLWKHAAADAFYAPPLSPVAGTTMTRSRDIGWQASALIEWHATERFEFAATYVTFEPGSVIRQAQGRDGNFFAAWIQWTF